MNLVVTGKQLELTKELKEMVEKEMQVIEGVVPEDKQVTVTLEAHPVHKASVLFYIDGEIVHLEQEGDDLYVLFPQLAKRTKKYLRGLKQLSQEINREQLEESTPMVQGIEEEASEVTKRKRFEMKPMSEKEAILQMKMLEHPQFIFANADLNDKICLLYTRKDGNFGVIETTY